MKDLKQIFPDLQKAFKVNHEKIMRGIVKRAYPHLTNVTVTYLLSKDDFEFTGLTTEQEAHVRTLSE